MANTTIPVELSSTPGIVDNSNATAITIDSSENVGIGTGSPDSKLHVDSGVTSTSDWGNIGIISDFPINNTGRIYGSYMLQDSESIKAAGVGFGYDGTGYKMYFGTAATTSSGVATQMTIDRSGNVGIGTASPNAALDILGATSDQLRLRTAETEEYKIGRNASTGFLEFDGTQSGYVGYIFKNGNVGIGTSSPTQARLDILLESDYSSHTGHGLSILSNANNAYTALYIGTDDTVDSAYIQSAGKNTSFTSKSLLLNPNGGNVGIGTTSPANNKLVISDTSDVGIQITKSGVVSGSVKAVSTGLAFGVDTSSGNTERMRIDSSGNVLVGTTNNSSSHKVCINGSLGVITSGNGNRNFQVFTVSNENWNVADTLMRCGKNGTTGRSINAGGTINASGADYAEYMKKSDSCGTVAKGDVCGVDSTGKLTDVFADALSFVIKSTNPSYVGGDTWGDVDLGLTEEQTETERQKYDRIAFSGQVPVNITGSFNVGDYVYPQANGTAIECVAKSSPTFEEYQLCVGKIWATQDDGRPFVAVKIG